MHRAGQGVCGDATYGRRAVATAKGTSMRNPRHGIIGIMVNVGALIGGDGEPSALEVGGRFARASAAHLLRAVRQHRVAPQALTSLSRLCWV